MTGRRSGRGKVRKLRRREHETDYYAPGACSIGIHVLLEEIGKPYEAELVNLREGAQYKPDFTSVNPKSKVPTLVRDDGSVLTEFPAIAYWLARTNPFANLLPDDIDPQTRALETDGLRGRHHPYAGVRAAVPRPPTSRRMPADEEAVKARGKEIAAKGFALLDKALEGKEYVVGQVLDRRCGAVLCGVLGRSAMNMTLPANCAAHLERCWRGRRCSA